jgi:hypothetical protein
MPLKNHLLNFIGLKNNYLGDEAFPIMNVRSSLAEKVIRKCSIEFWGLVYVHYIHKEIEEFFNTRHLSKLRNLRKLFLFYILRRSGGTSKNEKKKQYKIMED